MAVGFVAAGTAVAGTTTLTVAWPGSQSAGDIGLLLVETANAATVVASGWTELSTSPVESAVSTHGLHVLYKIAAGSDADVSVSGLLNHAIARILVFSGVDGTSPINATTQQAADTGTSITLPSVTTDTADCAIVHVAGTGRDATLTAVFSGWTNANLDSITEVADDTTGTSGGGGFGAAWGILASAGASGTGSCTQSVSVVWTAITVALKPASGGSAVTGTIDASESGSDTASLTGVVRVSGAISAAETGADAASVSGDVHVAGSLVVSESGADVAAIIGGLVTPTTTGTISAIEAGSDTASMSGDVSVRGSISVAEVGADTALLSGDIAISGALSAGEIGADTAFINGSSAIISTGTMSAGESGSDGCAIAGKVYLSGELSAVEGGLDGFAAGGNIRVAGALSASESGSDTASITGTAYVPGTGTLDPATIAAIANAVWAHSSAVQIEARLTEAWGRLGLDPANPLISGQTAISFGAIVMALAGNETSSTLTRQ